VRQRELELWQRQRQLDDGGDDDSTAEVSAVLRSVEQRSRAWSWWWQ
jgi:hypothetical protein